MMFTLADGISFGTGESALALTILVGVAGAVISFLVRDKIKSFEDRLRRVDDHEKDLAVVKANREACEGLEKRTTLLEKDVAVAGSLRLAERVVKLEEDLRDLKSEVKVIASKVEAILSRVESILEWAMDQERRETPKRHGLMRDPNTGKPV